jgi:NAD(P)-dependent dehydrogenase (short-subunit alcohol dehydrogenase family)
MRARARKTGVPPRKVAGVRSGVGLAAALAGLVLFAAFTARSPRQDPGSGTAGSTDRMTRGDEVREGDAQRVILITGSTDGLGRELALRLAATGAHVIVHGRNEERGRAVVEAIAREGRGSASFHRADFAKLPEVRALADAVLSEHDRLDVLINNAGIWLNHRPERVLSEDGHELHFAVNYLAGFLLTHLLLDRLRESAPARVVNVASAAQRAIDFDNLHLERGYSPGRAYAQSKLAQILFTVDLAAELEGTGVTAVSLHPATLMDTPMVRGADARPRSTVEDGVRAVLNALSSDAPSGTYFDELRAVRADAQAYDPVARARLREISRRLTGLD